MRKRKPKTCYWWLHEKWGIPLKVQYHGPRYGYRPVDPPTT